ncbi:MAG: BolA/IbaG family iron-sulfur metabolism protein [Gammaproteobacteria bacterium]|jgi:acid stress-induced BolA-like protein IbaG/YrbA
MTEDEIIARVGALHPGAVIDVAGEDCSFELYVISEDFAGKNTLERQRPILALFNEELASGKLHALSVKARTPAEQSAQSGLVQIRL